MDKTKVKVVIPIYMTAMREEEWRSLRQMATVLGHYPVVLVAPRRLDVSEIAALFPNCQQIAVGGEWLGTRYGIDGYNTMMMSKGFYEHFADTDYILICQTDAWIFRDELAAWCDRGYDYVGAPLPRRPIYDTRLMRYYLAIRRLVSSGTLHQDVAGRVFNGGLSLRRVGSFLKACDTYREQAMEYLSRSHHHYNEDVFWSLVPREFSYPGSREAMDFAFDVKAQYCYRLLGNRLPFGCHGWFKKPSIEFWRTIIG